MAQIAYENYHLVSKLKASISTNQSRQAELQKTIGLEQTKEDELKNTLL
jgi:hypothetical protein